MRAQRAAKAVAKQAVDVLRLLPNGGPGCCNIAVTNVCNATCDFCGYAKDKSNIGAANRRWIDYEGTLRALDVLHLKGIRYVTFSGGEPFLHPRLLDMAAQAAERGLRASVVTNGSAFTPRRLPQIAASAIRTLFISIDSPRAAAHERNRGLDGVFARIADAIPVLRGNGIRVVASVAVNRLIEDFEELADTLEALGFEIVTFAYPKTVLHSSSRVYSGESRLVNFSPDELVERLQAIRRLKLRFAVLNPDESLQEMVRHVRGEPQRFECFGGHRSFFMDWNFDVYRCDFWHEPLCKVWDFAAQPAVRDGCTACMSVCYRDSSVMMHFPMSIADALAHLRGGHVVKAARAVTSDASRRSLRTLLNERATLKKLARVG